MLDKGEAMSERRWQFKCSVCGLEWEQVFDVGPRIGHQSVYQGVTGITYGAWAPERPCGHRWGFISRRPDSESSESSEPREPEAREEITEFGHKPSEAKRS